MTDGVLGAFLRHYLDRVVNQRDLRGVDELVARDYRGSGHGWPPTLDALRAFYALQAVERPDWRIDVQETVELADTVVVRARAGGTVLAGGGSRRRSVEWLGRYRVQDELIRETELLVFVDLGTE